MEIVGDGKVRVYDAVDEIDCYPKKGQLTMTLTTGEVRDIEFEPVAPCVMSFFHGITCGDRVGIANFETTHNVQVGKRKPIRLSRGFIGNGWQPATPAAAAK